jgi:ribosomal protein S6
METRHYKATFIINLRNTKRDIAAITEWLKGILKELGAKVESVEDLGVRDFVRVTHKANPNGHYLSIFFAASGDINTALQTKLKLEGEVKRIFVESVETKEAKA